MQKLRPLTHCIAVFMIFCIAAATAAYTAPKTVYDFTVKDISGKDVPLKSYAGKVIMIVNVASKCGLTPQYDDLEKLYGQYGEKGFVVLGFPANNFANQEPGTDEEIQQFCRLTYGVTFPMFAKISVRGDDQHELYRFLTGSAGDFGGDIKWNFTKFLIGKDGSVINRFEPKTKPNAPEVITAIENALGGK